MAGAVREMPNVIEAHGLHRIYETAAGLTHALRGVSLSVGKGEFLCIMGPSGSFSTGCA